MKRISWREWFGGKAQRRSSIRSKSQTPVAVEVAAQTLESRHVLAAPTLAAISNVTVLAGSPLIIPLNGFDTDNQPLTFTATSNNAAVATQIPTGNRSLKMDVTNFGTMTFQLFEDRAPRVTNHIIQLANSDFYNGSKFHRVINNFVIQGGDPLGNPPGTGGSSLGDFDDQFDIDLQHNRTGLLSMAKTLDDTNDSQFFITEGAQRHLDFQHSIFGVLTTGESVRETISNVPVNSSTDAPQTNVVVSNVEVFTDTQNGVLFLKAPEGTSGSVTITVTVRDPDGNTAQRQFIASVTPDTTNGNPFLADIPKLRTLVNTAFTFPLQAIDVEGNAAFYLSQTSLAANNLTVPTTAHQNLAYSVDFNTGVVNLTPSNGLTGDQPFTVATGVSPSAIDYQVPRLSILAAASPLTISGTDHPSTSQINDGKADAFSIVRSGNNIEIRINGKVAQIALLSSVTTLTMLGSNDADSFVIDFSGGNPIPSGGISIAGGAGANTLQVGGNSAAIAAVTHLPANATSGSMTLDSNTISYSKLEGLLDALAATNRTFQFGASADDVIIGDDPTAANSVSLLTSAGNVPLYFTAPTASLVVNSGAGNDKLTSTLLDSKFTIGVKLQGGNDNDILISGATGDALEGQAGNDTLTGGGGNDTLAGGAGNDSIDGGAGTDLLNEVAYTDEVAGQTRTITLTNSALTVTQASSTISADTLSGIELASLSGGAMSDEINAGGFTSSGTTTLLGGSGNDTITGGGGNDSIDGGAGTDLLVEVAYTDNVAGQTRTITLTNSSLTVTQASSTISTDMLSGIELASLSGGLMRDVINASGFTSTGVTTLLGGGGNDSITGTNGPDSILTLAGADLVNGLAGSDTILTGSGNDTLNGGGDNDQLNGQNGDDSISGDDGNDAIVGGAGADTINGGAGNDYINGQTEAGSLSGGAGDDTIQGNGANDTLSGDDGDDKIWGLGGNDILNGGNGADILSGDAGNDSLNGHAGADILAGSLGDDVINGGTDTDRINEIVDGNVIVLGSTMSSAALGADTFANVERLNLVGGASANLFDARQTNLALLLSGEGGNDTLLGGSKGDVINGGGGDDVLSGGGSADLLDGGAGTDYFYEKADSDFAVNGLQISSAATGTETVTNIERIALVGGAGNNSLNAQMSAVPVVLLGGQGNDTLLGGSLADTLSGGGRGNSTVAGADGVDSLNGGGSADTYETDSSDTLVIVANVDVTTANAFALLPTWIDQL